MSSLEFPIFVSYSQVAVFAHSLDRPFNQWTEKHVAQGFSWRPGSAAFRTVAEGGQHLVVVKIGAPEKESVLGAIRVIDVPFEVPSDGAVEIGSISDSYLLEISPGIYRLRFECSDTSNGQAARVRFVFTKDENPMFSVVRADPELSLEGDLLLTTSAA